MNFVQTGFPDDGHGRFAWGYGFTLEIRLQCEVAEYSQTTAGTDRFLSAHRTDRFFLMAFQDSLMPIMVFHYPVSISRSLSIRFNVPGSERESGYQQFGYFSGLKTGAFVYSIIRFITNKFTWICSCIIPLKDVN